MSSKLLDTYVRIMYVDSNGRLRWVRCALGRFPHHTLISTRTKNRAPNTVLMLNIRNR